MSAATNWGIAVPQAFDATGFLREFEAVGGKVFSDGEWFAVLYPAGAKIIPTVPIDWPAVIAVAHERGFHGGAR